MKQVIVGAIACMAALGPVGGSSAIADDRELQAILVKQGCSAGNIRQTELSPAVIVYEVTCRGSGRVLSIVCVDSDCRSQPKARQDEDSGQARVPVHG